MIAGEEIHCNVYSDFLSQNSYSPIHLKDIEEGQESKQQLKYALVFCKSDIHTTEDLIKEIYNRFDGIKIFPVIEKKTFYTIDLMYRLRISKICFEFAPEQVLAELNLLMENDKEQDKSKQYIINFYENKETFIIDISGTLQQEKISALKLMFLNYLGQNRLKKLRGIIYIFNNTDEFSMNFLNTWTLFRFWESLGLNFKQVYYLTSSESIIKNVSNYLGSFGIHHSHNLLEIVEELYPELKGEKEDKLFEFASTLLQTVR